ncbi:SAV_915 family protein [Streptomyces monashensis]|uniref:SAV_915 family protein n=1 Tax=Streptomyces monashensis TaxID=1678012 RepID=UPI0009A11E0F|nr:SAV_915 family protein [Streptomyces monashensis]
MSTSYSSPFDGYDRDLTPPAERPKAPIEPDTEVLVPAHPRYAADPGRRPEIGFELLQGADGNPVAVAFTSPAKLVAALGDAQPWVAVPVGWFARAMHDNGLGPVRVDPQLPPGVRVWSAEDVRTYTEAVQ